MTKQRKSKTWEAPSISAKTNMFLVFPPMTKPFISFQMTVLEGLEAKIFGIVSVQTDGSWGPPQNFTSMNTISNEGILAISPDGNVAIVFGNYNGSFRGGDLFYSVKTDNGWGYPHNLRGTINTSNWESLAALGPDGKTLIYSTERKGDKGNSDLWVTQLTEKGDMLALLQKRPKTAAQSGRKYPLFRANCVKMPYSAISLTMMIR